MQPDIRKDAGAKTLSRKNIWTSRSAGAMRYNMLMVRHAHAHKHLHRKKKKDFFDYSLYFFMVATPLFELPQVWDIYSSHSAHDVSLTTWGFFFVSNVAWITYAVRNKLKPLIVAYTLYLIVEGFVVTGILLYS